MHHNIQSCLTQIYQLFQQLVNQRVFSLFWPDSLYADEPIPLDSTADTVRRQLWRVLFTSASFFHTLQVQHQWFHITKYEHYISKTSLACPRNDIFNATITIRHLIDITSQCLLIVLHFQLLHNDIFPVHITQF